MKSLTIKSWLNTITNKNRDEHKISPIIIFYIVLRTVKHKHCLTFYAKSLTLISKKNWTAWPLREHVRKTYLFILKLNDKEKEYKFARCSNRIHFIVLDNFQTSKIYKKLLQNSTEKTHTKKIIIFVLTSTWRRTV